MHSNGNHSDSKKLLKYSQLNVHARFTRNLENAITTHSLTHHALTVNCHENGNGNGCDYSFHVSGRGRDHVSGRGHVTRLLHESDHDLNKNEQ